MVSRLLSKPSSNCQMYVLLQVPRVQLPQPSETIATQLHCQGHQHICPNVRQFFFGKAVQADENRLFDM